MNETLTIASLGETTLIGALYDARDQIFINDVRLFNFNKLPNNIIETIPNGHSYYKLCKEDTYFKKFELMNISGDLAIKVACLPISIKGSAKYLNEFKKSENSVKWDLFYSRTTCNELINLQNVYEYYITNELALNETLFNGATHVVTGIIWGSNSVLSIEYENNKNESKHIIEGLLSMQFEQLQLIEISSANKITKSNTIDDLKETFKCEIKADLSDLDTICLNIEQAANIFKSLPEKLKQYNNGKGVQIEFHLSSLEKIKKIFKINHLKCQNVNNLSSDLYVKIQNVLQEIVLCKQKNPGDFSLIEVLEQKENYLKGKIFKQIVEFRRNNSELVLKAIDLFVSDLEALKNDYAMVYLKKCTDDLTTKKEYEKIIIYFDKIITLNPNYSNAYNGKGYSLNKLNKYDQAIHYFNISLQLNPNLNDALYNKGISLFKLSKYSEAIECFNRLSNDDATFQIGHCLRALSKYNQSIEYFNKAIEMNPNHLSAYIYKGLALKSLNRLEESKTPFNKANQLNLDPKNLESYLNKGLCLANLNKFDEAFAIYDRIIESNSNELDLISEAYNNKGSLLINFKKYEESIKCFNFSLSLDSSFAYAYNNKGISLLKLGRYGEAFEYFDKTIQLDPNCALAYNNKGILLSALKRNKEAIVCLDKALNIDTVFIEAINNKKRILKDFIKE